MNLQQILQQTLSKKTHLDMQDTIGIERPKTIIYMQDTIILE